MKFNEFLTETTKDVSKIILISIVYLISSICVANLLGESLITWIIIITLLILASMYSGSIIFDTSKYSKME